MYVFLSAFCYGLFLRCYYHSLSYGKIQQRTQRIQIYKKTLRRTKKAYRKSRKAPLKACIGKRYFIYYISCGYNCSFHINSKLNRHGTRICYSSF